MYGRLPITALRAFEAVARRRSPTHAASQLGGPPPVAMNSFPRRAENTSFDAGRPRP
ncbi:hypothetical protein JY651_26420 [Pyxidicoccus parkwayensis]|uniref:Uncharacterized protein n=1 Tax=Pyxidicoccus parkwayensis TaxID=2813578 RepID=A0ABX7NRV2_9BACT|nr:hypothetical protein [Pyxidicoccus parkwaysis]QSQ18893.1 hypothetical protein JY651_26420 [Pyxidicoccus parkwaysis]